MQKPNDYSIYFNEDGTKKHNPYSDKRGYLKEGGSDKWLPWAVRAAEIEFSFLPLEEQEKQQERFQAITRMAKKFQSSVG
jgi:hypothetical protein